MASPWTAEITPPAAAGLEQLLEEYGGDAYRDALRNIIDLQEDRISGPLRQPAIRAARRSRKSAMVRWVAPRLRDVAQFQFWYLTYAG